MSYNDDEAMKLWRDWVRPKDEFFRHLNEQYLKKKFDNVSELECVFCEKVTCIDTVCLVRIQTNSLKIITDEAVGSEYDYKICCEECYDKVMKQGESYLWCISPEEFEEARNKLCFIDIKEPDIEQEDWSRRGKIDL